MGFSIGSFFKSIAAPVLGTIGAALGGPIGATIGTAIGAGFAPKPRAPSVVGPSVGPRAFAGGAGTRTLVGGLTGLVSRGVAGTALVVGTLAELLFRARENTGQAVSRKKIVDSVRVCGIETTASMFGLSESEICQIVISRGRRRGRGISAADLRRTRSTIRKVHNISHDLQALVPRVRRHHRSKA